MKQPMFITLHETFAEAMGYRDSPQMQDAYMSFQGVQLLPNNELPYIQRTYVEGGFELESYDVYVMSICGDQLADITSAFAIKSNFDDPNTGTPQIEWSLTNIPFDAGYQLVYLLIKQGVNDLKYSSPFYLTADMSEYTERVDYGNGGTVYSTQLQIEFKQYLDLFEQTTYDNFKGNRTAVTTKLVEYEAWQTGIIDYTLFRKIKQVFRNKYVYVGLAKTVLFEPFETPRLEGRENFAEQELLLCRDESDKYDPLYVPEDPPTPPENPPFINLIRVDSLNDKNVSYVFTYGNFEPTYLQYEYSLDGETWQQSTGDIASPHGVTVLDNRNISYKYRITHLGSGTVSNIVTIAPPSIIIDNITSPQSSFNSAGNTYSIFYTISGFNLTTNVIFEASFDNGASWQPMSYSSGYQNPKVVNTYSSTLQFTKFRARYQPLGITSNIFTFSF